LGVVKGEAPVAGIVDWGHVWSKVA